MAATHGDLTLDETKLQSAIAADQGDVYLLQWLAKLQKTIEHTDLADLQSRQSYLQQTLLRIVSPPAVSNDASSGTPSPSPSKPSSNSSATPLPRPGRLTRQLVSQCLVTLFQRAESRSLFDVAQQCLNTAAEKANEKEYRVAALFLLGQLFSSLGNNIMSLFLEIATGTQKIIKQQSLPVIVRYHALLCLQRALTIGAKSLNDQPAKEIIKSLKSALADKAGAVARAAADCVIVILDSQPQFIARADIDAILAIIFKAVESADYNTKRALSRLAASLLASTQTQTNSSTAASSTTDNNNNKSSSADPQEDDDDDGNQQSQPQQQSSQNDGKVSPKQLLAHLSEPFNKTTASRKLRTAILDMYATLFTTLGPLWVQTHYDVIIAHLIDHLPNQPRSMGTRSQVLSLRSGIAIILRRVIAEKMLGEGAQADAIHTICSAVIKRYPVVMPGQPPPPTKYTLVLALDEVTALLRQLGTVPPQVTEALYDSLLRCLAHPSHSVQISAAWCLRVYCTLAPNTLTFTIQKLFSLLKRDLDTLANAGDRGGADLPRRANGHARGLATLISIIPSKPLYTSFDVSTQVLDLAVELLRDCGNHPLPISAVEIQVAWTLISSLMSLGPSFVRLHLNQLLLLWRNGLPKPGPKDLQSTAQSSSSSASPVPGRPASPAPRSDGEWAFLLHVREVTLTSILAFLHHNSHQGHNNLLNLDTARRIVALLSNTLAFVDGFAQSHTHLSQEQVPGQERSSLSLLDREHMLRRRIFQCFSLLSTNPAMGPLQDSLVMVALQTFAEPDRYVGSAAQAAIAASAGNFTTLWAVPDGYAYGVTSLQSSDHDHSSFIASGQPLLSYGATTTAAQRPDPLNRDPLEAQIDALQHRPVLGAPEHDPLVLFAKYDSLTDTPPMAPPPATAMVDAAMELFAALVPFQNRNVQIAAFETMLRYTRSNKTDKNPGRRAAIQVNCSVAALGALKTTMQGGSGIGGKKAGGYNNDRLTTAMREVFKDALLLGDTVLRAVSSQNYGRLAAVAGSHAMSSQVQFLVDQVVSNRDPDARAGCALAFGAIYSQVGGLSAGPLTKTVVNVLMSLSSDPHPTVHYSALEALRLVVDAASLSYSPYVTSTLGMLVKLCMADTHEPEGGSAGSVNLRADLQAHQSICRVISALIGVLGPDLEESGKVQELIYILLDEFSKDADDGVVVEATKATRQFSLFAPQRLDVSEWIAQLTDHLRSHKRPRKVAAITGFYQLVQRQALAVSKIAGDGLVADLFAQLDLDPSMGGVREVLLSWLRQTAELSPGSWIDICQRIMSRSAATKTASSTTTAAPPPPGALQDEEAATIDLGDEGNSNPAVSQGSRWRTQLFALQCLHQIFLVVRQSGRLEHFQAPSQGLTPQQTRALMSSRVADLIRMAFTASTAPNAEIRLEGLTVLRDVIENFKSARDPDFHEALMLEQHQAPIAAALTPAFASDSTPEVLAAAIQICAVFVGSGVVRQVDKMGRILRQLVSALENCQDAEMNSLGDAKDLCPNAAGMLKVAVFTAWSELQVATLSQAYLLDVVKPHLNLLAPYWIASLKEYAKMKIDPESVSAGLGLGSGIGVVVNPSLDSKYAGLAREVLMPHYEQTWYKMVEAVSVLLDADHPAIIKAMDGGDGQEEVSGPPSAFRSEPTIFFFVLYGLVFEALSTSAGASSASVVDSGDAVRGAHVMRVSLQAVRSLSKPQYSGTALLQESSFEELCNLCYRIVLTESVSMQNGVVDLVLAIGRAFKSRLLDGGGDASTTSADTSLPPNAKLTQLLRIIVCVIERCRLQRGSAQDKTGLLRRGFEAYQELSGVFSAAIQEELYANGMELYASVLREEGADDLVSGTLPCLKDLCDKGSQTQAGVPMGRAVHGFLSLGCNTIDGMRGRAGRSVVTTTKNCLVAATVVLTSVSGNISVSRAVLEQLAYLINQKISSSSSSSIKTDSDTAQAKDMNADTDVEIGLTAANCARSILLASAREGACGHVQFCAGQLLPGLIEYVVNAEQGDKEVVVVVGEVLKCLESFASGLPSSHASRVLSIVLPVYLVHIGDSSTPTPLHTSSIEHLLTLATKHPQGFKEAMSRLRAPDQSRLETGIRNAVGARRGGGAVGPNSGGRGGAGDAAGQTSIALKSFGS
ncbi:unnamed protein product [Sympodiomycopsis kandeliae]